MKIIYQISIKRSRLFLIALVPLYLVSCGSFKNVSVDDSDGIYNSGSKKETTLDENQTYTQVKPSNVYVDKFKQIQNEFAETEYFTDIDSYQSTSVDTVYVMESNNYAGWGNNTNEVSINYYDNNWNNWGWNNWGWNNWYGPGWNNGLYYGNMWGLGNWNNGFYYGNTWGLGYNNYGWNNWCGNSYYGNSYYGQNASYTPGRRGINNNYSRNSARTATVTSTSRNAQIGNATVRPPRARSASIRNPNASNVIRTRDTPSFSPRSSSVSGNGTTNSTIKDPRPIRTSTKPTTTSPRNNSTPRNSPAPRSSYGGSNSPRSSSSSSGGGRTSGGSSRGGNRGGL
ncbi:hypothetical protein [uncultured Flavobacterium sp.]|uniref:hypothetical protein n=1 Tax=uncultured Flavobacterium sp. TaxID=165435 RepID=UPI0030CA2E40